MPVRFISKPLEGHSITELQYEMTTSSVDVGGMKLDIRTLSHVERAIDHVFQWLETKGRPANEIERLAPYFGTIWPSALALTGYLLQEKVAKRLSGKKLIELGCGLALPSIVSSKLQAQVTAMDNHPDVPRFLSVNTSLNEPCDLQFVATGESGSADFIKSHEGHFDFVVASDVLYESQLVAHFAAEITQFASPCANVVVADPGRPYIQEFVNAMKKLGWVDELQSWTVQFQGRPHDIFVLIFSRG